MFYSIYSFYICAFYLYLGSFCPGYVLEETSKQHYTCTNDEEESLYKKPLEEDDLTDKEEVPFLKQISPGFYTGMKYDNPLNGYDHKSRTITNLNALIVLWKSIQLYEKIYELNAKILLIKEHEDEYYILINEYDELIKKCVDQSDSYEKVLDWNDKIYDWYVRKTAKNEDICNFVRDNDLFLHDLTQDHEKYTIILSYFGIYTRKYEELKKVNDDLCTAIDDKESTGTDYQILIETLTRRFKSKYIDLMGIKDADDITHDNIDLYIHKAKLVYRKFLKEHNLCFLRYANYYQKCVEWKDMYIGIRNKIAYDMTEVDAIRYTEIKSTYINNFGYLFYNGIGYPNIMKTELKKV